MKFYEVVQRYYDNGIVTANTFIVEADEKPESVFNEGKTCDIYKDYFICPKEAEDFRLGALALNA